MESVAVPVSRGNETFGSAMPRFSLRPTQIRINYTRSITVRGQHNKAEAGMAAHHRDRTKRELMASRRRRLVDAPLPCRCMQPDIGIRKRQAPDVDTPPFIVLNDVKDSASTWCGKHHQGLASQQQGKRTRRGCWYYEKYSCVLHHTRSRREWEAK